MWWLALVACADLQQLPDCEGVQPVQGTAAAVWSETGGAELSGTARHPDGLALRSLRVAEVEATPVDLNYGQWTMVLDAATTDALVDETGALAVDVVATDACGVDTAFATVELAPDAGPDDVAALSLDVQIPGGADYLPADGSLTATLTVMADAGAVGQSVALSASLGELSPASVTLEASGDGATATASFASGGPGPALITAVAGERSAFRAVQSAGPPVFVPDYQNIEPGEALGVQVLPNGGTIDGCSATGDLGVFSDGDDLTTSTGGGDGDGDGVWDVFVTAAAGATAGHSAVITCADVHGQQATGVVEVPDIQP